jgi:hypothetical protein
VKTCSAVQCQYLLRVKIKLSLLKVDLCVSKVNNTSFLHNFDSTSITEIVTMVGTKCLNKKTVQNIFKPFLHKEFGDIYDII